MDNILKDFYFGRYAAFERKVEPSSSHAEAIDKVVELEEALMNDLPSELLPRFRSYSNAVADLASITAEEEFEEGVRLGIRIMMAAFPKELGDTTLPPIPERK